VSNLAFVETLAFEMVDEISGLHENANPFVHAYFTTKGPGKRNDVDWKIERKSIMCYNDMPRNLISGIAEPEDSDERLRWQPMAAGKSMPKL
jgi:hypothetical protein